MKCKKQLSAMKWIGRKGIRKLNRGRFFTVLFTLAFLTATVRTLFFNGIFGSLKKDFPGLPGTMAEDEIKRQIRREQDSMVLDPDAGAAEEVRSSAGIAEKVEDSYEDGIAEDIQTMDTTEIVSELKSYIENFEGVYGIHFLSLFDDTEFGINDTDEYDAASTTKVPLNLYIFRKIEEKLIDPENTMAYTEEDYCEGTGIIQYAEIGTEYTVRELCRLSIVESDNVATNMLKRLIGGGEVYRRFMKQSGGLVVDFDKNISCPRDMSLYLKMTHEFFLENKELGGELISYLSETALESRLDKLLPPDVTVAHKIGTQLRSVHDVGIIYSEKPYILSVMSKDVDEDEAPDVIANISKKVYDFVMGE